MIMLFIEPASFPLCARRDVGTVDNVKVLGPCLVVGHDSVSNRFARTSLAEQPGPAIRQCPGMSVSFSFRAT